MPNFVNTIKRHLCVHKVLRWFTNYYRIKSNVAQRAYCLCFSFPAYLLKNRRNNNIVV